MSRLRSRKAWLLLLLLVGSLWPARVAYRAFRDERGCFQPSPREPRLSLREFGVPELVDVTIPGEAGASLRGYYAPSKNGAAVVLAHGSNGERSDLQPEAELLSQAGFGVVAFDFPGHGQSPGRVVSWSAPERAALRKVVDWLEQQPGVDRARVGAFGFSMGGYIVTQAAVEDTRLRAVALASTPHDPLEHLNWEYRKYGPLSRWPALLALRLGGMDTETLVPARVIGRISPRPLLLIGGGDDPIVPSWITERLYAAAGDPKRVLFVPKAGHGGFVEADPQRYPRELVEFFGALLR